MRLLNITSIYIKIDYYINRGYNEKKIIENQKFKFYRNYTLRVLTPTE